MQNIGFLHSLSRLISQYLREYSLKVAHLMSYKNQDDVHGKLDHNLVADSNMYAQLLPLALPAPPIVAASGTFDAYAGLPAYGLLQSRGSTSPTY